MRRAEDNAPTSHLRRKRSQAGPKAIGGSALGDYAMSMHKPYAYTDLALEDNWV